MFDNFFLDFCKPVWKKRNLRTNLRSSRRKWALWNNRYQTQTMLRLSTRCSKLALSPMWPDLFSGKGSSLTIKLFSYFCLGSSAIQFWSPEGQVRAREAEDRVRQEGHGGHLHKEISPGSGGRAEVWDRQAERAVAEGQRGCCQGTGEKQTGLWNLAMRGYKILTGIVRA